MILAGAFALCPLSPARAQIGATEHFGAMGFPKAEPGYDKNPDKAWLAEPGNPESKTCDGDVMNTIFSRAYTQAQQDVLMNQLVIHKPDSVLEYTCFDQLLGFAAYSAAPIFSETQALAGLQIDVGENTPKIIAAGFARTPGALAGILETAVYDVMTQYLERNFWHTYLGGTTNYDARGGDAQFPESANYVCDAMAKAWQYAKCENFADTYFPDQKKTFYTLDDLINLDPRIYPAPMRCDNSQITQDVLDASENAAFAFARFQPPKPPQNDTYMELLAPGDCARSTPIPTGMHIKTTIPIEAENLVVGMENKEWDEYTCSNPRCHYDGAGACVQ